MSNARTPNRPTQPPKISSPAPAQLVCAPSTLPWGRLRFEPDEEEKEFVRPLTPEEAELLRRGKHAKTRPEQDLIFSLLEKQAPSLLNRCFRRQPWAEDYVRADAAGLSLLHGLMDLRHRGGTLIRDLTPDKVKAMLRPFEGGEWNTRADHYRAVITTELPSLSTVTAVNTLGLILDFWTTKAITAKVFSETDIRRKQLELQENRRWQTTVSTVDLYNFLLELATPFEPA